MPNKAVDSGIPFVRKHMISVLASYTARQAPRTQPRSRPSIFSAGRLRDDSGIVSAKHAPKRRRQGCLSGGCFPRHCFLFKVHQSAHEVFVLLETHVGHVYRRRKHVQEEGREHASLTKTMFQSEPSQAQPVVEPHARMCSHAIVELKNDRDHTLWHAKTGEYCL